MTTTLSSIFPTKVGYLIVGCCILSSIDISLAAAKLTQIHRMIKAGCTPERIKANDNYICDLDGSILCLPGFTDVANFCDKPVCDPQCIIDQGNCTAPNVCTCELGWYGANCSQCLELPGCQQGSCIRPFECICEDGWDGQDCNKPICKQDCIHGTCSQPGECNCHPGWNGENCDACIKLPGCNHGYCTKPLECICVSGYEGHFCHKAVCGEGCNHENGFCTSAGECWCRPGYDGPTCTNCMTYPGCQNGFCNKPWDCHCQKGWSGRLCNKRDATSNPVKYILEDGQLDATQDISVKKPDVSSYGRQQDTSSLFEKQFTDFVHNE